MGPHHEPILKCFFPILDLGRDRGLREHPPELPIKGLWAHLARLSPCFNDCRCTDHSLPSWSRFLLYNGGGIHILLVIAIIVILLRFVVGRNAVQSSSNESYGLSILSWQSVWSRLPTNLWSAEFLRTAIPYCFEAREKRWVLSQPIYLWMVRPFLLPDFFPFSWSPTSGLVFPG